MDLNGGAAAEAGAGAEMAGRGREMVFMMGGGV
jgi:hypothetical protein